MRIGGVSAGSPASTVATGSSASQSASPTFSNMTPAEMESAREELTREGRITLHQSVQMALMDGYALQGVNGGRLVTGSTDMYTMIDEMISYQEKDGIGDVKDDIASLRSLRSVLQDYDQGVQDGSGTSTVA